MTSADLLLHPTRLRIVEAFLGDRALTTGQLAAELADIPPASLYRHVAKLVQAGVLMVVASRRVRGAVERTYVLRGQAASIGPDEVAAMTAEDHRRAFLAFVAGMVGDFDRYLDGAGDQPDLARDHIGYRMAALWLTDDEFRELARDLGRVLAPRMRNLPSPERTRHILRNIWLPGRNAGAPPGGNAGASEQDGGNAGAGGLPGGNAGAGGKDGAAGQ